MKYLIGISKTLFNSSVAHGTENDDLSNLEIILTERLTRKKANGAWPELALRPFSELSPRDLEMAENRDVHHPQIYEDGLNKVFPFYEHLQQKHLAHFTKKFNPNLKYLSHHWAHAYSALGMSPFERAVILVMDGAGSSREDYFQNHDEGTLEEGIHQSRQNHEEYSIYLQDGPKLRCVYKKWQQFVPYSALPNERITEGIGIFYETIAQYIFNSKRSSGKVMGLSDYSFQCSAQSPFEILTSLDWAKSFQGKGKNQWDTSPHRKLYEELASITQGKYEEHTLKILEWIRRTYPDYENLIFVGGSALNCTFNMKAIKKKIFKSYYVPPFPGDEGISFGLYHYLKLKNIPRKWEPLSHEKQQGYFGPKSSAPTETRIKQVFSSFPLVRPSSITEWTARRLQEGKVIAWFQGRSESGPRALGNRSILARIDREGLKEYLNSHIKFRESFRPYGCSCLYEKAPEYFELEGPFDTPYMSYAVPVRPNWYSYFKEVTHVDQTSRFQTVRETMNPRFYQLIFEFGKLNGVFALLNTSFNIMGEPIVETLEDAKKFLETVPVDALVVGDFYIESQVKKL